MRLWSLHPKYLDMKGLVALWREGLLAKKVLEGKTRGYRKHPQLERFKSHSEPLKAINAYLFEVWKEGTKRGYRFDRNKIEEPNLNEKIPVTRGQVKFEFEHLLEKLKLREPTRYEALRELEEIEVNPVFRVVEGDVEMWEKAFWKKV